MITRFLLAADLILFADFRLCAQDESPQPADVLISNEFVICPVTTELQRSLLESDTVSVCVFINGGAFRDAETIDRFLPAFKQLQEELTELPKAENSGIVFRCIDDRAESEEFESLEKRLESLSRVSEEVGYYAGYLQVKSVRTFRNDEFDWQKWIDKAQAAAKAADTQAEDVMGNERVQVFFVRTFLSHLLTRADCKVTILPVVRSSKGFPDDFMPDLQKYLSPAKREPHGTMLLDINYAPSLSKEIDAWIEDTEGRKAFARSLGYELCNVSPGPTSRPDGLTQGPATRLQINLKVLGPDGKLLANPQTKPRTYPNVEIQTIPGPDGTVFKIGGRPRDVSFSIIMPGFAPYIARWDANDHPESLPTEFTAKLGKAWTIGGIVVDDQGQPIPYAEVHLSIEYQKRPGDTQQLGTGSDVTTDEEGRWSFASIPDTELEVNAEIHHPEVVPGWNRLARSVYEVPNGEEPEAQIKMSRGISFQGQVVDDAGKPIAGAQVRTRFSNVQREATSDDEGQFELSGCREGTARMVISAPGKAMMLEEVRVAPNMRPVSFTMQPGGHLKVRVLDPQGNPSPGARIFLQEWKGRVQYFEFDHVNTYADDNGVWEWNEAPLDEFIADVSPKQGMQLSKQRFQARAEEYVIKLNPTLEISATVVDAETKQPVQEFRVVTGRARSGQEVFWNENDAYEVTDGKLSQTIDYPGEGHLWRIEADGYKSKISREVEADEGAVRLVFEMEKGKNIQSIILQPDGKPALDAVAYLARPNAQVMIKNGYIREHETYATRLGVDETGKFSFTELDEPFQIFVTHSSGYAHLTTPETPLPAEIKLQPWAKLQGTLFVGSQPAANVQIDLSPEKRIEHEQGGPRVFFSYEFLTDSQGNFEGDRIAPGRAQIGMRIVNVIGEKPVRPPSTQRVRANFLPGETTHVKLGGTGRPVIGKLVPYEGFEGTPDWEKATIMLTAGGLTDLKVPKPPAGTTNGEQYEKWWREWIATDQGKAWQEKYKAAQDKRDNGPHVSAWPQEDGEFRIDDVDSGVYSMSVYSEGDSVGRLTKYEFTVPPMDAERSDEPLDLGEISLEKPVVIQPFKSTR